MIRNDGKVVCNYVHRIIAKAFIANPEGARDVDHVDGNPRNNAVGNLRWVTHRENIAFAMERRGNWLLKAPKWRRAVRAVGEAGEKFEFVSVVDAAKWLSDKRVKDGGEAYDVRIVAPNLVAVCRGRGKMCYGFRWEYVSSRMHRA